MCSLFTSSQISRISRIPSLPQLLSQRIIRHSYATFIQKPDPVDLDYNVAVPANGNKTVGALIILHGLFGSKRNWSSLSKALVRDLDKPIYALDLRNQGTSPHTSPMTYTHMAADVLHFIHQHKLSNVSLLGHSMGGKVAMALALDPALPSEVLLNLIVEDIAPQKSEISEDFKGYVDAMKKIEDSGVKARKEANDILVQYEKDASIRQFLLTNLIVPATSSSDTAKFQVPLAIIKDAIPEIGSFPYEPKETAWDGRTLFIKGEKSKYINRHNLPLCKSFFPSMTLESLDTGHWVHAERPNEFRNLLTRFINGPRS